MPVTVRQSYRNFLSDGERTNERTNEQKNGGFLVASESKKIQYCNANELSRSAWLSQSNSKINFLPHSFGRCLIACLLVV
mmetsp:Transcript_243/g.579  ORF Transcript_243/g.579 Transcript_243/m.579 type:complete len:80 (-) Transcript_243:61-300(-)